MCDTICSLDGTHTTAERSKAYKEKIKSDPQKKHPYGIDSLFTNFRKIKEC